MIHCGCPRCGPHAGITGKLGPSKDNEDTAAPVKDAQGLKKSPRWPQRGLGGETPGRPRKRNNTDSYLRQCDRPLKDPVKAPIRGNSFIN